MANELTKEERDDLIGKVTELADRGVLKKQDAVEILNVCGIACARRIAEIDAETKPEGPVQ